MKVEFIGLCLMVMNATGFTVILPDWDGGAWIPGPNLANHYAIIAAPAASIVSAGTGWKKMGAFIDYHTGESWIYFVIDGESVRFENTVPTGTPSIPGDLPQLGTLCSCMAGIDLKYLVPGSGAASHVYVSSGIADAQPTNDRIDTVVTLKIRKRKNLIINAGGGKKLEVKSGSVRIGNVPMKQIDAGFPDSTGNHENHFLAYYKLASNFMGRRCRKAPDSEEAHPGLRVHPYMLGTGCSNSQYP